MHASVCVTEVGEEGPGCERGHRCVGDGGSVGEGPKKREEGEDSTVEGG